MFLRGLWEYLFWCIQAEISAPVCRPFWIGVLITSFALAGLIASWMLWALFSEWRKRRAAVRARELRDRIDVEAIAAARWNGDDHDLKDAPAA